MDINSLTSDDNLLLKLRNKNIESFKWDLKKPEEAHKLIREIPMPEYIKNTLTNSNTKISKQYVHKLNPNNVMISSPIVEGNIIYFRGYNEITEFNIDHNSDHLEGIKLFEVVRQATLASFHIMGVALDKIMVITSTKFNFKKLIELRIPYFIQIIPVCKKDGGAMFTVFNIIQGNNSCTDGFLQIYTFRSKESYEKKRLKK
ncbi:hypothetical protein JJB63_15260 [Clostridium perfringens]|uniref:AfsA-related hotdog domain-containing protein n=1 Tax=Clostridium perfringens TaxID=1502 RepID=UPI001ABAD099|nr:AfsA-related hotdog domain-containing protein [Clostridium perfringens]MBO3326928.1 hypothetical protein [Clostridium perfringens]